ncbi:MAG: matrixin family metalloprotease [Bacteriovoracaceae bacterium]
MSKNELVLIFVLLFLMNFSSLAHVQSRTSGGVGIRWNGNSPSISMVLDTGASADLSAFEVATVLNQSVLQYQSNTSIQIAPSIGTDAVGVSSISFTNEPYFGAGILAVTNVGYNASTGNISEADILINENYSFSTNQLATGGIYFLGDVLTHELGHVMGLSHSEVQDSSMIYTVFRGQWSLAEDDINGLNTLYTVQGLGSIKGKVVGGLTPTGIFGAKVEALSTKLGKVIASTISLSDGTFTLGGLPLNDTYYLYVSPLKSTSSIPAYYSSAINKLCSGSSYRGSFFTKCGGEEADRPQALRLSSTISTVNVGNVSIRCNFSLGVDYLDQKSTPSRDERTLFDYHKETGGVLSGVFFNYEKLGPSITTYDDEYTVDLTTVSSPSGKYLDLQFISQSIFSALGVSIYVTRAEGINPVQYNYLYNASTPIYTSDMVESLNRHLSIPLSSDTNENIFTIRLVPVTTFTALTLENFFPSPTHFVDNLSPYLLTASVSQLGSLISMADHAPYADNTYCSEKTSVVTTTPFTTNKDVIESSKGKTANQDQGIACGTVDMGDGPSDGGGPSGPASLVIGFFSILIALKLKKSWYVQKD